MAFRIKVAPGVFVDAHAILRLASEPDWSSVDIDAQLREYVRRVNLARDPTLAPIVVQCSRPYEIVAELPGMSVKEARAKAKQLHAIGVGANVQVPDVTTNDVDSVCHSISAMAHRMTGDERASVMEQLTAIHTREAKRMRKRE